MSITFVHQGAGLTKDRYEEGVKKITGKSRFDSTSDWPVDGLLVHIAGETDQGFRIIEVWESEDAARAWAEQLLPILKEVGIIGEGESDDPADHVTEAFPVHTLITP